ncbi:hypothetical protein D3C72_537510 [compost metagenome]
MANVKNNAGIDGVYKAYSTASDRWSKNRDEAIEKASTFGIGPIRIPRGPFANDKAIQDAQERFAKLEAAANSAMEILKEALTRNAGR